MDENEMTVLIEKVYSGQSSELEKEELEQWYSAKIVNDEVGVAESDDEESVIAQDIWNNVGRHIKRQHYNILYLRSRTTLFQGSARTRNLSAVLNTLEQSIGMNFNLKGREVTIIN